jgi:F-type H+-transporting ATPase subunit delta
MKAEAILARRYAQAFLNVLEISDSALKPMQEAIAFLSTHKEIESLLAVPVLKTALKVAAIDEHVVQKFNLPAVCKQLIAVLANQGRISLVCAVLKQIIALYQERHAIEPFVVKTSHTLSAQDGAFLQEFLAAQTHARVPCTFVVDQELIGGIRMQSAEHIWEYSIAKQLKQLQASLQH